MFKWLNRPLGKNKHGIQQLPQRESKDELEKLVVEDKTQQEASSDSLRSILRRAIADAEQTAASIKTRAQAEAEAEAGRIIAQANIEAQEIKGKAEIAAQREAEDILSAAKQKAEITEVEAKQRTLRFLVTTNEEIEKEIFEEYKKAYSRLSISLQNLVNEGQNIGAELESKAAKFWENRGVPLKEYEALLLSTSETALPLIEIAAPTETKLESITASKEVIEQTIQTQEEALEEKVERPVQIQEKALEEEVEEPVQLKSGAVVSRDREGTAEELPEQPSKDKQALARLDSKTLYTGEVELVIASPVELKIVTKLYNYLQTVPELKILYTRGSWDRGTTMTVVLEKPLPLIGILLETPDVKVTPELLEKDSLAASKSSSPLKGGEKVVKKIQLVLKEAGNT